MKLVVSEIRDNLCDLDLARLVEFFEWSIRELMIRENVTCSEDNLFVLWILDKSDPLNSVLA